MLNANPSQQEAIKHVGGPLLIIAGPGSGKTFTLVERIIHLITQHNVAPESLLIVTFTEKAAQELKTRVSNRLIELDINANIHEMYLGTIHSVCLRILEEYRDFTRLQRNFSMMDQFDQQYFLYQNIEPYHDVESSEEILGKANSARWRQSESLLKWLNKATEEALDYEDLINADDECVVALGECLKCYHQQLEEHNLLDFSTIQYETLKLLRDHPTALTELREKIHYLMVDEFQDTNAVQEMILKLLCADQPNICVVGDDDQGLYRFRGASIRNILTFQEEFGGDQFEQISLTTNYRSHPDIIHFYNRWMNEHDWEVDDKTFRYAKTIEEDKPKLFPETATVIKVSAQEGGDWHQSVHEFLLQMRNKGTITDWNQVAFLFRSVKNPKVVTLASYLEKQGMPVYSPRSNMYFDRDEVRLMIGAMIFLFPQFPAIRKWNDDAHMSIWDYYDHNCFAYFAEQLGKKENESLLKWARKEETEEYEVELVKIPEKGYYEVSADEDKIVCKDDKDLKKLPDDRSFHLDTYCFDSNPEKVLFWKLIRDKKIKEVYFMGMLTHGQTDFYIQYIDPESHTVRSYYPDFLFKKEDDSYVIVEVKGEHQIDDPIVNAKQEFAEQIAVASGMKYKMIGGNAVSTAEGYNNLFN